ncbi:hypothetical protein ACL6C3_16535 [Capilliphycus salinus ALCB114379]|uniref:hypothetical protein n=1 Tax=Capilliphycus salinus TaxID=2768948 RepID=UPI0039A70470
MRPSVLNIYSTRQQQNPPLSSGAKTNTWSGENWGQFQSPKLNSNSTSNPELILTQLRLEAIESELARACYLYRQLCEEFDGISLQNQENYRVSLDIEREEISREIFAIINQIAELELERINLQVKLNFLTDNQE